LARVTLFYFSIVPLAEFYKFLCLGMGEIDIWEFDFGLRSPLFKVTCGYFWSIEISIAFLTVVKPSFSSGVQGVERLAARTSRSGVLSPVF
jgi:hypothetical protein